jgi:hypothetical protein
VGKHFSNFSERFKHYNPDAIPSEWGAGEKTFDENGLLHSYDDKPICAEMITKSNTIIMAYTWYSHGLPYREGDKPVRIIVNNRQYETYNENLNLHSFDDQPSMISWEKSGHKYFNFNWHTNGVLDRENDLPAHVEGIDSVIEEKYYSNGSIHRSKSLPALKTYALSTWMVQGYLHNPDGAAGARHDYVEQKMVPSIHALYGVAISKKLFDEVKAFQVETNIPLWVSFLTLVGFISKENLKNFMQPDGFWNPQVPSAWVIRSWGITEENFMTTIKNCEGRISSFGHVSEVHSLYGMLKIINFEKQEALQDFLELEEKSLSNA